MATWTWVSNSRRSSTCTSQPAKATNQSVYSLPAQFIVTCFAILSPWMLGRLKAAKHVIDSRPGALPNHRSFSTFEILHEDTVRNCEDVVIEQGAGFALLSCDPGRDQWNTVLGRMHSSTFREGDVWMYLYSETDAAAGGTMRRLDRQGYPPQREFHLLGIEHDAGSDAVFVVNHASSGVCIEVFKLSAKRDVLIWRRTFEHAGLASPNSIAAINEHELFVTNDHYFPSRLYPFLFKVETYAALPIGSLVYVNLKNGTVKTLANLPFANGVTLLNSTHLAVASTTAPGVQIYKVDAHSKDVQPVQWFDTPFGADNVVVDSQGKLLIAGHPYVPDLEAAAATNHEFDLDGLDGSLKPASERQRVPSRVAEWDGNGDGSLKDIYIGREFGGSTTAVRDCKRKIGIITGLYEKGILVWRE